MLPLNPLAATLLKMEHNKKASRAALNGCHERKNINLLYQLKLQSKILNRPSFYPQGSFF
jgi:hypothetical protein